MASVLHLAGAADGASREGAAAVLALETRLAEASLDGAAASDPVATDHPMTFAQLDALAPAVGWSAYFDEAHLPRVDLVVAEPKLLLQVDKEPQGDACRRVEGLSDLAPARVRVPVAVEGVRRGVVRIRGACPRRRDREEAARALLCAESTDALLPDPLGKLYVERYFPPAAKARVQDVIQSMMSVLRDDVARTPWMQPETRKKALLKLATYSAQVGQPDTWRDFSSLTIRRDTLWANTAAARRFNVDANRKQIGHPTDPHLWQLPSSSSSLAYLDLQLNEIVLPAGFLQWPQLDPEANDAVLYGAIGAAVAHDMTHSIDALGSTVDPAGRPTTWWSDADRNELAKRSQCVIDQVEAFEIEPGIHHEGKRVLSEAIGDLAGVRIAYAALRRSLAEHPVPVVAGFTPEPQFFLAAAQARGEASSRRDRASARQGRPAPGVEVPGERYARQHALVPGGVRVQGGGGDGEASRAALRDLVGALSRAHRSGVRARETKRSGPRQSSRTPMSTRGPPR